MTGLTQQWHIIVILLIALMPIGGRRLPEIGRSPGTGMREFKDSEAHSAAMQQLVRIFPDIHVHTSYPIQFGSGDWITVIT